MTIRVSFACNFSNSGRFAGAFEAVDFSTKDGTEVTLVGPRTPITWEPRAVVVTGASYPTGGRAYWEGNWCWDACSMPLASARELIAQLKALGFTVDEAACEGPLADLAEAS